MFWSQSSKDTDRNFLLFDATVESKLAFKRFLIERTKRTGGKTVTEGQAINLVRIRIGGGGGGFRIFLRNGIRDICYTKRAFALDPPVIRLRIVGIEVRRELILAHTEDVVTLSNVSGLLFLPRRYLIVLGEMTPIQALDPGRLGRRLVETRACSTDKMCDCLHAATVRILAHGGKCEEMFVIGIQWPHSIDDMSHPPCSARENPSSPATQARSSRSKAADNQGVHWNSLWQCQACEVIPNQYQ
ncbi:hypothetical protein LIA77_07924 [Sarocladium implicatum]|nr:hypothetical protein LIA77_07924 [Sarocladium implicatum]